MVNLCAAGSYGERRRWVIWNWRRSRLLLFFLGFEEVFEMLVLRMIPERLTSTWIEIKRIPGAISALVELPALWNWGTQRIASNPTKILIFIGISTKPN
jgi:hypothetical protein